MILVEIHIHIDRDPESVFEFIANFENNPLWQNGIESATFTTPPPVGVGSKYDQRASFLGREVISSFEVLEVEPGRRVKATSPGGSFPITFTREVSASDQGGTDVHALIEGDSTGFFRLAEPLMAPMVRRSIEQDYDALKELLEADTDAP